MFRSSCLSVCPVCGQIGERATAGSTGGEATSRRWSVCCSRSERLTHTTAVEVSVAGNKDFILNYGMSVGVSPFSRVLASCTICLE